MTDHKEKMKDRIVGCIVGGAIGDAYGGVRERGGIWISDDTQLTLATCEAICGAGAVSPEAIAEGFAREFRGRRFRWVGSSTLKALRDLEAGAHWALAGAKGERTAGNGAAMRIAPLAFLLDPHNASDRVTIRDVCRITHHNDEAYCGALAVLLAIRLAESALWQIESNTFRQIAEPLPDSHVKDRLFLVADAGADTPLVDLAAHFGASGFVAETVPMAIAAAMRTMSSKIESVVAELAEIDGDMDTIGSIAGQIAGANLGLSRLPPEMIAAMSESAQVLDSASRFAEFVVHGI